MSEETQTAQQKYRENNREKINEYEKIRRKQKYQNDEEYREKKRKENLERYHKYKKEGKNLISISRNSRKTTQDITRNITNNTINLIMQKTKNEF